MTKARKPVLGLVCVVVGIAAAAAFAQGPDDVDVAGLAGFGDGRPIRCLQQAYQAANVTPQQDAEIQAIREKLKADIQTVRRSNLPPEQKREQMKLYAKQAWEAINNVLTDQQKQTIRQWLRVNCPPRPGQPGIQGCWQRALRSVGLPDGVLAQIKSIRDRLQAELQELRSSDLPPEQKKAQAAESARRAKAAIEALLSEEQKQAIRQWMQENCDRPGPAPGPGPNPKLQCFERALRAVGLPPETLARIDSIEGKLRADLQALRTSNLPPEEKKLKAAELMRAAHQAIMALLSQREKQAVQQWMAQNCRQGQPGPRPGIGPNPGPRPGKGPVTPPVKPRTAPVR